MPSTWISVTAQAYAQTRSFWLGVTQVKIRSKRQSDDGVDVVKMTRSEYEVAARESLKAFGLTYDQLAEQARRRTFSSPAAADLWMMVRDSRPHTASA